MNLVVLKVIVTASTFVIAVLGIWASYKLRKFTKWFDIASAFSAGIIMATAYTHMLPEAIHLYDHYLYDQREAAAAAATPQVNSVQLGTVGADGSSPAPMMVGTAPPLKKKKKCPHHHHHHGDADHDHAHFHRRLADEADATEEEEPETYPLIPFIAALSFLCLFLVERGAIVYMKNKNNHSRGEEVEVIAKYGDESGVTCDSPHPHDHGHDDHGNQQASTAVDCCKDIKSLEKMSEITAFALIMAVSLHAVTEGMGMGSRDNTQQVITAFIGVAAHKGLEGFAVGANLVESAVSTRRFIMYAGVVCLASPLGALIGYLMTLGHANVGLVNPILGALAVGTFLQVATMEFLPRAFAKPEHFWLKALGLLAGFAIMSVMPLFVPHEH